MPARTVAPVGRRYSLIESLFIGHQAQLTDYIAARLPGADQHTVEDLTQETWLRALSEPATRREGTDAEGLPGWIARAAALAIHHHTTPQAASDRSDDGEWLTQLLGPAAAGRSTGTASSPTRASRRCCARSRPSRPRLCRRPPCRGWPRQRRDPDEGGRGRAGLTVA
ncbi:hypothetical protein AB0B79_05755 [Streptomyces sp. NPDC039022]|uniref:hypothetical protein n=1 Tax=unclassified Streptomyces TaxID=2593676 RepID=UPI00340843ED